MEGNGSPPRPRAREIFFWTRHEKHQASNSKLQRSIKQQTSNFGGKKFVLKFEVSPSAVLIHRALHPTAFGNVAGGRRKACGGWQKTGPHGPAPCKRRNRSAFGRLPMGGER